jgi:hypothetical protein
MAEGAGFSIRRILLPPAGKSRRRVVVGRRGVVRVGGVVRLSLDLSLNLAEVLLHLPQVIVRQHDGMPAVLLSHRPIVGHRAGKSRRRGASADVGSKCKV